MSVLVHAACIISRPPDGDVNQIPTQFRSTDYKRLQVNADKVLLLGTVSVRELASDFPSNATTKTVWEKAMQKKVIELYQAESLKPVSYFVTCVLKTYLFFVVIALHHVFHFQLEVV